MPDVTPDSTRTIALLDRVRGGDRAALDRLLEHCRPAIRDFVEARFDRRLTARLDPSDLVQEAQMDVARRMDDFLERRPMPFHLWVRKTAYERVLNARRHHGRRARRSVDRERPMPDRSSLLVARPLLARGPSPSQQAEAREFADRVGLAVGGLGDTDREVLTMRHAEHLSYDEIGCLLDVEPAAARKRYGRALIRLQNALAEQGLLRD